MVHRNHSSQFWKSVWILEAKYEKRLLENYMFWDRVSRTPPPKTPSSTLPHTSLCCPGKETEWWIRGKEKRLWPREWLESISTATKHLYDSGLLLPCILVKNVSISVRLQLIGETVSFGFSKGQKSPLFILFKNLCISFRLSSFIGEAEL